MSDPNQKTIDLSCNILLGGIGLVVVLSLCMILPPHLSISYFNTILFGHIGYPQTMSAEGTSYANFLYAVLACVMIGWMIPMIYLAHRPLRTGSTIAWKVIVLSLGVWFVMDSGISITLGYWQNAASNTALAIVLTIPLLMIHPHLIKEVPGH